MLLSFSFCRLASFFVKCIVPVWEFWFWNSLFTQLGSVDVGGRRLHRAGRMRKDELLNRVPAARSFPCRPDDGVVVLSSFVKS
jgi:hypothetical protein